MERRPERRPELARLVLVQDQLRVVRRLPVLRRPVVVRLLLLHFEPISELCLVKHRLRFP
jgi:hypothetical protein